jgi:hypothetical protein
LLTVSFSGGSGHVVVLRKAVFLKMKKQWKKVGEKVKKKWKK